MADDGSSKGHGGKPGRKSTVLSMSAHKNRHNGESESASKKVSSLTLFDFSPSDAAADEAADVSTSSAEALPCENTPFERNDGLGEITARAPGRKFLRWGPEDGGPSEHIAGSSDFFEDEIENNPGSQGTGNSDFLETQRDRSSSKREKGRKWRHWQHKTSRSGSVVESFYHAIHGLRVGFASQRNVRIHCAITVVVLAMALLLRVDAVGCLALSLATGFVLFAEYINTSLEHITDIQADFRYNRSARYAKDTAAAAVLIAALTAVLIGAIVFVPRLFALMSGAQQ
jgi:diacylglycerol kinase